MMRIKNSLKISNKISCIYGIVHISSKKIYVGSATRLKQRWKDHIKLLKTNNHYNRYLQAAWNKYGESAFKFKILELVYDKTNLVKREQYWMDFYESYNNKFGYNISPIAGSTLGVKYSVKAKKKLSISREKYTGKNHPMFGKHHTIESIEEIRLANLGHISVNKGKTYEEFFGIKKAKLIKKKQSKAKLNKYVGKNNPNFGRFGTIVINGVLYSLCKNGHPKTPENLFHGNCIICRTAYHKFYYKEITLRGLKKCMK